jgi:hypothetical protein
MEYDTIMNEQLTEQPSTTRRITDAALVIIAFAAIAAWLWRRLRRPAAIDGASDATDAHAFDDKVGETVPNNASV